MEQETVKKKKFGGPNMTPERHSEIAREGARVLHALDKAYKWTPERARAAGRKGGAISRKRSKLR